MPGKYKTVSSNPPAYEDYPSAPPAKDVFSNEYTCELNQKIQEIIYSNPPGRFNGYNRKDLLLLLVAPEKLDGQSHHNMNKQAAYYLKELQTEAIKKVASEANQPSPPPSYDESVTTVNYVKSDQPPTYYEAVAAYQADQAKVNIYCYANNYSSPFTPYCGDGDALGAAIYYSTLATIHVAQLAVRGAGTVLHGIGGLASGGGGGGDMGESIIVVIIAAISVGMASIAVNEVIKAVQEACDGGDVFRAATILCTTVLSTGAAAYFAVGFLATAATISTGGLALAAFFGASVVAMVAACASRKIYDACSNQYSLTTSEIKNIKQSGCFVRSVEDQIGTRVKEIEASGYTGAFSSTNSRVRALKAEIFNLKKTGRAELPPAYSNSSAVMRSPLGC